MEALDLPKVLLLPLLLAIMFVYLARSLSGLT